LLRVPFGRTRTLGVVVELSDRSEVAPERLATPEAVLPVGLPPDLVALAGWIAREYCSTPARALSLLLAPGAERGMKAREVRIAAITDSGRAALRSDSVRLTDRQREILTCLHETGAQRTSELGSKSVRRLESRGLVTLTTGTQRHRPARHGVGAALAQPPPLSDDQQDATDEILRALKGCGSFLLHGVTGSGKTEVYLRAVEATLDAGRCAIVLVPEIALTPQAMARFEARFGDVVAVIHSALTERERFDEWQRLASGQARVCVGPRSAIFAPLQDIGLIVIDEEHEGSYKHEGDPRYDARTVARRRARDHRALLLLGSATPRPETAHATNRLRLPKRIDGRPLPGVEILDMRGLHHPLHPESRLALSDLRRAGGKAIVLLNRRGWSNFLSCRACGEVWMCPNCEVALVLHRDGSFVACHHCGHRARVPGRCPKCASVSVARHGAGTERIEHELIEAFGDEHFPVLRLDADLSGLASRARTLQRFEATRAGVLVGTQMVAKGHDFPDVALAIVLDADQTLRFPDFRSEERTFAMITQLAGRAGRGGAGCDGRTQSAGRVLVQTLAPGARSIRLAAQHDSDGFLAGELARRRALRYPPFGSLIRIVCSAIEASAAVVAAADLRDRIKPPDATILGPAPLFRLRGKARSQLVIKAGDRAAAIAAVGAAVDELGPRIARRGTTVSVDVDPR
jgi:primosomal protein N' (replication factor Y)